MAEQHIKSFINHNYQASNYEINNKHKEKYHE